MRITGIIALLMAMASTTQAQYPDGTLVLSSKRGIVGRVAKRITGGDSYTHVAIVIDGYVYEMDYPKPKRSPVGQYGKRRTTNDYYVPLVTYSASEVASMRTAIANSSGQRYGLKAYFRTKPTDPKWTWCSPYVGRTLNATGRYRLSSSQFHEPQNLIGSVAGGYRFHSRVRK